MAIQIGKVSRTISLEAQGATRSLAPVGAALAHTRRPSPEPNQEAAMERKEDDHNQ